MAGRDIVIIITLDRETIVTRNRFGEKTNERKERLFPPSPDDPIIFNRKWRRNWPIKRQKRNEEEHPKRSLRNSESKI